MIKLNGLYVNETLFFCSRIFKFEPYTVVNQFLNENLAII
jgi:hypothetical protein